MKAATASGCSKHLRGKCRRMLRFLRTVKSRSQVMTNDHVRGSKTKTDVQSQARHFSALRDPDQGTTLPCTAQLSDRHKKGCGMCAELSMNAVCAHTTWRVIRQRMAAEDRHATLPGHGIVSGAAFIHVRMDVLVQSVLMHPTASC